ncbi:hypothetical protein C9374_011183 [Naegleria lovaniensis]|uniref:Guanine nucleotide-binding protein subunit beta-like protein n=1 Tax=Naegleria lovaniensis TaxID=51637 RepID=A0AA88KEZ1_NAELO|nr:uncharacterized protein C9374_011183 [Naegleria lovaniensis]KAG2374104.1 hypothetical protein C9374_011183 [Naegleria lovaniensis]
MSSSTGIQEAISNARREAQDLHEQIKNQRKKTNDANLRDMDVPDMLPMKIRERRVLRGHYAKIYSLAWGRDSTSLVSASQDGKLIIWDAVKAYKTHAIPLRSHWVMCCDYSPSGNAVACGGLDNICSVFLLSTVQQNPNATDMKPHRELTGHTGYLSCCKFLNDRHILTSSGDQSCILWDIEMNQPVTRFEEHTGDCMSVSIKPDGDNNLFLSGSCDGNAKLWDIRMNKCVATFTGHEGDINSVQFFPNGNAFATGSDDCSCRLFDIRAAREVMTYSDDNVREGVTCISFTKSGRVLFSAYEDKKVIAWDTLKGKVLQTLEGLPNGHENRVSCLAVSPDGHGLATCSWDMTVKIFA